MYSPRYFNILIAFIGLFRSSLCVASDQQPVVVAHYMPWYATKDVSGSWGWHWTMNHFDPDHVLWDGNREVASHDQPLIGPYDSGDEHALECQVLLMKFSGLQGVIIDWYGRTKSISSAPTSSAARVASTTDATSVPPCGKFTTVATLIEVCFKCDALRSTNRGQTQTAAVAPNSP
jgi:hypothetical protein